MSKMNSLVGFWLEKE